MSGLFSKFVGEDSSTDLFASYDEHTPQYLPEPGPTLEDHHILTGEEHVQFHKLTRDIFEERGIYDVTFGYNLAKLNLDTRHPEAGFRYAVDADDDSTLHAEFTPTTAFCPQSDTLSTGAFRAWNGLSEQHEYDLIRVSVAEMHHHSGTVNAELRSLEEQFLETGSVPEESQVESTTAHSIPSEEYPTPENGDTDTPF